MTATIERGKIRQKERPLLFLERTLVGDGNHPFNGVFAIRLKGTLEKSDLTTALLKLQHRYPQLQMAIAGIHSVKPYFFIPDSIAPIGLRVKERQRDDQWQQEVLSGLKQEFNLEEGTMIQVVCLSAFDVHDLILSFHHCICDGGGGIVLIRELLSFLDEPALVSTAPDRLLNKEDIIPANVLNNPLTQLKTGFLATVLKSALAISSLFISTKNKRIFDRKNDYIIHLKLDALSTSRWIKSCKEQQVTVNTALGLLLLQAYEKKMGNLAKNKVACPVDIRRFASQIKDDQLFSFGLILTLSSPKHQQTFWQTAKFLQASVDKQTKHLKPYEFLMTFEKLHNSLPHMLKMLTYGKVGNDLMFSNVGRIALKRNYRNFELETVFSPTVIGPFANPSTLICSTFDNQLDFSFVSNEEFLPKDKAEELMSSMKEGIESLIEIQD